MNIHKQIKSILTEMAANLLVGTDTQDKKMIEDADFDKVIILINAVYLKAIMDSIKRRIAELEIQIEHTEDMEFFRQNTARVLELKRFESVIKEILGDSKDNKI